MKTTAKMRDDLRTYEGRGRVLLRDTLMPDVLDDLEAVEKRCGNLERELELCKAASDIFEANSADCAAQFEAKMEAFKLLQDIEKWEAKWVLDDRSWSTSDGLPKLTQELYDEWIALQTRRNRIIKPNFSIKNGHVQ